MSHEHEKNAKKIAEIKVDVCIISDSRTIETDESGKWLCENVLKTDGFGLGRYDLIKNDPARISEIVEKFVKSDSMALVTSGGTGVSSRDVTIETIDPAYEKRLAGFGEIFRLLSFNEIGARAIMSRAMAGVVNKKLIISLPGSKNAVMLAYEKIIAPQLGHLVYEATR